MRWRFTLDNGTDQLILSDEPMGWADAEITIKRDMELHGVFFEYSFPLKFYDEGYDYISNEYQLYGIEAHVSILIEMACSDTDDFSEVYTGSLNFSQLQYENDSDCFISIPIEAEGCLMMFNNTKEKKVDLASLNSLDGSTVLAAYSALPINIPLAPKSIREILERAQTNYISAWGGFDDNIPGGIFGTVPRGKISYWQLQFDSELSDEILNNYIIQTLSGSEDYNDVPLFLEVANDGDYTFDFSFIFGATQALAITNANISSSCSIGFQDNTLEFIQLDLIIETPAGLHTYNILTDSGCFRGENTLDSNGRPIFWGYNQFGSVPVSGSFIETLNAGDWIKVYVKFETSGVYDRPLIGVDLDWYHNIQFYCPDFKIVALTKFATTQSDVFLINEALSRTSESMTNDCLRVYSDYFGRTDAEPYVSAADGCGGLECITNGQFLRNFLPANLSQLSISWKELYDGLNTIHCIGMGIEDDPNRPGNQMVRVEPMKYFYGTDILMQCLHIPSIVRKPLLEKIYNSFKTGYANWQFWDNMGLDEFNTNREYINNLTAHKATLEQICQFIASGYAVEGERRSQYDANKLQDLRYDKNNFIICLMRDAGYSPYVVEQGNITASSDIIDPATIYNARISPARNALRWFKVMQAVWPSVAGNNMKFSSGEANFIAEMVINDSCEFIDDIIENMELLPSSFNDIDEATNPFKAEEWEFEYPMSVEDFQNIQANPLGLIQVQIGESSQTHTGYIKQIKWKPNEGMAHIIILPSTADSCTGIGCMIVGSTFIVG